MCWGPKLQGTTFPGDQIFGTKVLQSAKDGLKILVILTIKFLMDHQDETKSLKSDHEVGRLYSLPFALALSWAWCVSVPPT